MVLSETKAFASRGTTVKTEPTQVPGGTGAQLMTFTGESDAAWTNGATTNLDCSAVFADGPDTYNYSAYVCTEAGNEDGIRIRDRIIASITLGEVPTSDN